MSGTGIDRFLHVQPYCRVTGTDGALRFAWDGAGVWVELRGHLRASRATVVVEDSTGEFPGLHGVEVSGTAGVVAAGAVLPERLFAAKYPGSAPGADGWLQVLPGRVRGWDLG